MKIIIFGASGTGKTTLGKSISKKLNWTYLDSDDYYWEKTNPPFQTKIPLDKRNKNLTKAFQSKENVIISGSLCTWSSFWDTAFDIGIFLRVPQKIRMKRLLAREIERYGEALNTNEAAKEKSKAFLEWAKTYDDETNDGASISQHKNWIELMDCPVIEINGDFTNEEIQEILLKEIEDYQ